MKTTRLSALATLGCAAFLCAACGTLTVRAPSTMERPKTTTLGSSLFDTPTQHNDPQRTGAHLQETRLSPATVAGGNFERLFDWPVDGQIYTQPLYVSDLPYQDRRINQERHINLVLVATTNNTVYAFEAPAAKSALPPAAKPVWSVDSRLLGRPLPYDFFLIDWGVLGHNMKPEIGITATPVVDRQRGLVYVTVKAGLGGLWDFLAPPSYRLFALDLMTGDVVAGVRIEGSYTHNGQTTTFDPKHHLQRASLLEANDRIYLAFGSHQDTMPYHGWVFAYEAETLRFVNAYCTTCDRKDKDDDCSGQACEGGIWQAGGGPALDSDGNLYVMSGNGGFSLASGVMSGNGGRDPASGNRSISFIKLDKDLKVVGSWTPAHYACLSRTDADLGSAGPTYLKEQSVLIGGGKEGLLYALSREALEGSNTQPGDKGKREPCDDDSDLIPRPSGTGPSYWSIQAAPTWSEDGIMDLLRKIDRSVASQGYHHIHGSPVQWKVHTTAGDRLLLYVSAERDWLRAYQFDRGFPGASAPGNPPKDTFHSQCPNSSHGMPGGFLTISADGDRADSGIVWAAMPRRDQDALNHTVRGVLRAYRAYPGGGDVLTEIWNSDSGVLVPGADCKDPPRSSTSQSGDFAKFVPPTVAEGKVYLSTFSHRLVVYGLKEPAGAEQPYDALLQTGELPASVAPADRVRVTVTATNTGTRTWRADDGIELGSQTVAAEAIAPVQGSAVLTQDVQPGQSTTFTFTLTAPADEGAHDLTWRLWRKGSAGGQPAPVWFGGATADWEFTTLKGGDCIEVRARAAHFISQIRADRNAAQSLAADIRQLRADAESGNCSLHVGVDPAMSH